MVVFYPPPTGGKYVRHTHKFGYPDKIILTKFPPEKNPPRKISLNAVEREPVETTVLNPIASEASYKTEQRSYRKTKLNIIFFSFRGDFG